MLTQGEEGEIRSLETYSDEQIVSLVREGQVEAYALLMRRYNRRVFRAARAILGSAQEAEDVMQDAYVRAYAHLAQFAGEAKFSTWLTRIAVHEALARRRTRSRWKSMDTGLVPRVSGLPFSLTPSPEEQAGQSELKAMLEAAIDTLPTLYRCVFVLRCVEELSVLETAECLKISEDAVKMRLYRARRILRQFLLDEAGLSIADFFEFHLSRCDRVVRGVLRRLEREYELPASPTAYVPAVGLE